MKRLTGKVEGRVRPTFYGQCGNAEFAGVDKTGVDNSAPCYRGGICRSGQISTMWQGWTLQEWTMQEWSNACEKCAQDKLKVTDCM